MQRRCLQSFTKTCHAHRLLLCSNKIKVLQQVIIAATLSFLLALYLSGAEVDVGGRGSRGSSRLVRVISLVEDAPQQGDRRHDGVEDRQNA